MSSYPPPFDRNAWKAQQRMAQAQQRAAVATQRAQLKMQRAQWKAQRRAMRRRSMTAPLLLIVIGVVFLLTQTGTLSWNRLGEWYAHWWPAVLIAAGLILVAEWGFARGRHVPGEPYPGRVAGGGLIFLLIMLAFLGWSLRYMNGDRPWGYHFFGPHGWTDMMGDAHESDSDLSSPIATGAPLLIRTPHGDVTVTGSSTDGQVHVSVHKSVRAWESNAAQRREEALQPVFSSDGNQLVLTVGAADASSADVTVQTPHETAVTIESKHGDVTLSELRAAVSVTAQHGDVETSSILGPVKIHVSDDDASLTGHSVTGSVDVEGRAGDMTFTDISGTVTMHGDFFGATHLSHIANTVRFQTSRTQFEAARLDGDLDIANDAELTADQLLGPVTLTTTNRNITLERVEGKLTIADRNGSVHTTSTSPLDTISIRNDKGSIEVGLPERAGFVLEATARHGDVDAEDFGRKSNGDNDSTQHVSETIGSGGATVTIDASDGDVTVHKSIAEPLAPAPPAPPKVTTEPAALKAPEAPAKPGVQKPEKPAKPSKPSSPKPPVQGDTF